MNRPTLIFVLSRAACAFFWLLLPACEKERELGAPRAVPVAQDGALRLRVMTFNVRHEDAQDTGVKSWRERMVPVIRMIREEEVDVLAVQEAFHGQVADLWASLPDYEFLGAGRLDGKRAGEYTGLFYRREKFDLDPGNHGSFWLSDTPDRAGSKTWGNHYPRMVAWGRLRDRASGRSFLLYNTHWSHRHQDSRVRASALMAEHLAAQQKDGEPAIVLGDFNATVANGAIVRLRGKNANNMLLSAYDRIHGSEKQRNTLHF